LYQRLDTPWTHIPHSARASVRHSTPANVLVPLKDVKYEGNLETVSCPPHDECGPWRMDFGGGARDCVYSRTISLVSHASKLVSNILARRLQSTAQSYLEKDQFGFRKRRVTRNCLEGCE